MSFLDDALGDAEGHALVQAIHDRKELAQALDEAEPRHTFWCAGNHEGPCRRGRLTGTER